MIKLASPGIKPINAEQEIARFSIVAVKGCPGSGARQGGILGQLTQIAFPSTGLPF